MSTRKASIAKEMPKHFANEKYRLACAEPYLWMCKAREVRRAADLLWRQSVDEIHEFATGGKIFPEPFFCEVAMMLYGLTMENLLKAGLAAKGVAALPNGNFGQKTHDLQALAQDFGLTLTSAEAELVERLQQFVEWAGRYPIPLYRDALYPREMLNGDKGVLYGVSTGDGARVTELLCKIESHLPTEDEALESYAKNYRA